MPELKVKNVLEKKIEKSPTDEEKKIQNSSDKDEKVNLVMLLLFGLLISLLITLVLFVITRNFLLSGLVFIVVLLFLTIILFWFYLYLTKPALKKEIRITNTLSNAVINSAVKDIKKKPVPVKDTDEQIKEKIQIKKTTMKFIIAGFIVGIFLAIILFLMQNPIFLSIGAFIASPIVFFLFYFFKRKLDASARVHRIEAVFPDFLQMMSSNLRAGMTIDKAMFLSAREEFTPLDEEIQKTGKDITTGKTVENSLIEMSKRIGSDKINKVVLLLISGIRAGGNLATLLEETSVNMREKDFVEKRAASNVGMYVIFIFLTVAMGAPVLFSLSSVLVGILTGLLASIPTVQTTTSLPFTMSKVSISVDFILYFCMVFILATDILASLTLGLVSKGEEKEGLKYLIPIVAISFTVFFVVRLVLSGFMSSLFSSTT